MREYQNTIYNETEDDFIYEHYEGECKIYDF